MREQSYQNKEGLFFFMEKPLFYIGFGYYLTLVLLAMTGTGFAIALLILSILMAVLFFLSDHGKKNNVVFIAVFLACVLACSQFLLMSAMEYRPAMKLAGSSVRVEGTVTELSSDSVSGAHRCIVKVRRKNVPHRLKIRFSSKKCRLQVGDRVRFTGTLYPMESRWKAKRIYLGAYTFDRVEVEHPARPGLRAKIQKLRTAVAEVVSRYLAEPYDGAALGLLTGDDDGLDEEEKLSLKRAGILHLFAVSGFHCSLWTMLLWKLLTRIHIPRKPKCVLCLIWLLFFTAMTGFSSSCIRAALMLAVTLMGRLLYRRADGRNSLGLSVFLLSCTNPFSGADISILLSVSAMLGVLFLFPAVWRRAEEAGKRLLHNFYLRRALKTPGKTAVLSLCTMVTTLPVLMLTFGGVSLVSPLTNVLAGTAASSAVLCVGLGTAFAAVPLLKLLTPWLFLSTGLLTRYLFAVCHALGKWSIAYVNAEGGEVRFAVACILLLLGITGFLYYSSPEVPAVLRQTVASICTIILLTSVFSHQLIDRDMVTVTFPTVGNGSMAVVSCRGNSALVGCGGDYRAGRAVSDCMSRDGSRFLSCVLAPRGEGNTDSALRELSEELHPSRIVRGTGKVQLYPGVMVAIRPSYAILDVYSVRLLFAFMPAEAGRSRECGADLTYVRSYKPALYGDDGEKYSLEPSGIRVLIRGQRYKVERLR